MHVMIKQWYRAHMCSMISYLYNPSKCVSCFVFVWKKNEHNVYNTVDNNLLYSTSRYDLVVWTSQHVWGGIQYNNKIKSKETIKLHGHFAASNYYK